MNTPINASTHDRLTRLYALKQKQLRQASQHTDSLQYRVLVAEARAISDALKASP
ncbi:hypothetical protein [Marinobacter sp. X15-166B]|uniref:hypothetical protein n=1 Tax=Marinobacter sp. X15-166B TaxID=1897620 RepID=UPI0018E91748|nr:hypothetical protein [Marinobacter sp. X15-166B]